MKQEQDLEKVLQIEKKIESYGIDLAMCAQSLKAAVAEGVSSSRWQHRTRSLRHLPKSARKKKESLKVKEKQKGLRELKKTSGMEKSKIPEL